MFEDQHLEGLFGAAAGLDDAFQALGLLGEHFKLSFGLGFEFREDGAGLAFGLDAAFLRLGLGLDDNFRLLCLGGRFQRSPLLGLDPFGFGECGLGHRAVLGLLYRRLGFTLPCLADLV